VLVVGSVLAPEPGPVNVTTPPLTGSPTGLVTLKVSGLVKVVLTVVLWLSPPVFVSVKPCDSNAPMSQAAGRATPRWSRLLTGAAAQLALSPASMADEPGSSGMVCVIPP
jgi:hypothetical protein